MGPLADLALAYDIYSMLGENKDDPMAKTIKTIIDHDKYHFLLPGNSNRSQEWKNNPFIPEQVSEWIMYCDGGYLFDTVFLSSGSYLSFYHKKSLTSVRQKYVFFAFNDNRFLYCFRSEMYHPNVYVFDLKHGKFVKEFSTFHDWLIAFVNESMSKIREGKIKPLEYKKAIKDLKCEMEQEKGC